MRTEGENISSRLTSCSWIGSTSRISMSEQDQKVLASFIKGVHHALRRESKKVGVERAWVEHCSQQEMLQQYAKNMQQLATHYWDRESNCGSKSRIDWVVEQSHQYFVQGGMDRERDKERRQEKQIEARLGSVPVAHSSRETQPSMQLQHSSISSPLYLLDVGSCYNPFRGIPNFEVLPIDLVPASPEVFTCNFLDLMVVNPEMPRLDWDVIKSRPTISQLPANSFHIVVFSLFLEYLPTPEHRYICCEKAYSLLQDEGLLFIITPDIRQASKGSMLMKNWRITLAHIGFSRVCYEKLTHIQCMAYRKCPNRRVPLLWVSRQKVTGDSVKVINIPQDFHDHSPPVESEDGFHDTCRNEEDTVSLFTELPDIC